jgi:hypothetical protein
VWRCGENDAGERKGKNKKKEEKELPPRKYLMAGSASAYEGKRRRSVLKRKC